MRLTSFTDYTLRSLMFLGMNRDRLVTIQDIADLHSISKNHLTKVIHQLGVSGMVETVRGRNGGLRLKQSPAEINIGAVVRASESDFFMAECFDASHNTCAFNGNCFLKTKLEESTQAYLRVLDGVTLADLLPGKRSDTSQQLHPVQLHLTKPTA